MKLCLDSETMPTDRDLLSCVIEANSCIEYISQYTSDLDEVDMCMSNMQFAIDSLSKTNDKSSVMDMLGLQESCESLLGIASEKITAKVAMEGIGQKIKDAWKKFIEMCKRIWQKIKEFFTGTIPDRVQSGIDRIKKVLGK